MSGGLTPYAESRTLDFNLGAAPAAGTGASYISLHTGAPATGANEVTGGGYARRQFVYTKSGSEPTTASNTAITDFPVATANWGTITAFALWDAATGGNLICYGTVTTSKPINSGDTARFQAGSLIVTSD